MTSCSRNAKIDTSTSPVCKSSKSSSSLQWQAQLHDHAARRELLCSLPRHRWGCLCACCRGARGKGGSVGKVLDRVHVWSQHSECVLPQDLSLSTRLNVCSSTPVLSGSAAQSSRNVLQCCPGTSTEFRRLVSRMCVYHPSKVEHCNQVVSTVQCCVHQSMFCECDYAPAPRTIPSTLFPTHG